MKIRTDFVTNSSSSSFITVFAKISEDKAENLIKENKWGEYVISGKELEERTHTRWFDLGADWAGVFLDMPKTIDLEAKYFLYENCEGDDCDFCDEDSYDYDYDIDLDFFSKSSQDIYMEVCEENGFTEVQQGYGAGRNG